MKRRKKMKWARKKVKGWIQEEIREKRKAREMRQEKEVREDMKKREDEGARR